jgi:hypothetical protein
VHIRETKNRHIGEDNEREKAPCLVMRGIRGDYLQVFVEGAAQDEVEGRGLGARDRTCFPPWFNHLKHSRTNIGDLVRIGYAAACGNWCGSRMLDPSRCLNFGNAANRNGFCDFADPFFGEWKGKARVDEPTHAISPASGSR